MNCARCAHYGKQFHNDGKAVNSCAVWRNSRFRQKTIHERQSLSIHSHFLPFAFATVFLIKFARVFAYVTAQDRFAQAFHEIVKKGYVVQAQQHCAVHFARVDHVAKIGFRVVPTAIAVALGVER